ncbi:hypothetical protein [Erythrobacter sp. EC-HK427]|uniref:hypothetical protein n=1 Tax=Erythrobacter sp. EC-HK427 TaxID=2038396 RepID=UPI001253D5F8|nr:hypothetical protein [Erythrobacter sp. EC-HK427]VVT11305.1 conserved hypothetical protein [Erythrobacter sp. EC-HK427]
MKEFISANLGLIELVFSASVALGFGIWQYVSISREIARDKAKKAEEETACEAD